MTHGNDLSRREALKRLTATAVAPIAAGAGPLLRHPLVPARGQEWQPLVFDAGQAAIATALADTIIPDTDTPGAAAALVHEFIDFDLSEAPEDDRAAFLEGLSRLDAAGRTRYRRGFADLNQNRRNELVRALAAADPDSADRAFFDDAKRRTVVGYYMSRIGLHQELQYRGNAFLREFTGCTHPEHQQWEPEAGR